MAGKDKVYIDIIVDDKGTTRRVAVDSKKLGLALDDVEKAHKKGSKSTRDADRNLKGLSKQSSNTTKNFSKMAQGMTGTLVPAYAILASNIFAITAAFQFLKKAADFRVMQDAQVAFTGATGVGMQSLTANIQAASGAMLDFQSASEGASIGIASGLGAGQLEELAAGAGNLSKILGRDVTDSFNRLVRGVTKAEPELLDELGITLRLTDAQTKYAATLGKSVKDLTVYEKKQAVFVEVQGQLERKYNQVAKATDVQGNSVARLGVAFDKIMKSVKKFFAAIAEPTAEFLIRNLDSLKIALALLAVPIIKAIIPGMDEWGRKSSEAANTAAIAYRQAKEELEELEEAQERLNQGQSGIQDAVAGVKNPSKGVKQIQKGDLDKLEKAQVSALLRAAEKNEGAVKQMNARQKADYMTMLRAKKRGSMTFFEWLGQAWRDNTRRANIQFKKMTSHWKAAMAKMQAATAKFTKGVNFLMKGMGLVGIALMIKDLGIEILRLAGFLDKDDWVVRQNEQLASHRDIIGGIIKEYEDFNKIQSNLRGEWVGIKEQDPNDEQIPGIVTSPKGGSPVLKHLEAQGNFFNSINISIREANNLLEKQNKIVTERTMKTEALDAAEVSLAKRIKQSTDTGTNKAGKYTRWAGAGAQDVAGDAAEKGLNTAKEALNWANALLKKEAEYQKQVKARTALLAKLKVEQDKLSAATKESVVQAIAWLENTKKRGDLKPTEAAYLELLKKIRDTGGLVGEDLERFNTLTATLAKQGGEAKSVSEQYSSLSTKYDETIAGVTDLKTSYSDLIEEKRKVIKTARELAEGTSLAADQARDHADILEAQMNNLKALEKLELKFARTRFANEKKFNEAALGRSSLEKEVITRDKQIAEGKLKIAEIEDRMTEYARLGITISEEKRTNMLMEIEALESQNALLERQTDLTTGLVDAGRESMAKGLSAQIASVIKGDTNIKDAILNLTKSIVEGIVDELSKRMTQSIMSLIPGYKTQEEKTTEAVEKGVVNGSTEVKTKMEEGAAEVKTKMEEALTDAGGKFISALDDAADRFASAIREACHACSCGDKSMGGGTGSSVADMVVTAASVVVSGSTGGVGGGPTVRSGRDAADAADAGSVGVSPDFEPVTDRAAEKAKYKSFVEGGGSLDEVSPIKGKGEGGFLSGTVSGIKNIFGNFGKNMKNLFDGKAPFTEKLGTLFGKEGFLGDLGGLFDGILGDFGGIFDGLMNGLGGLLGGIGGGGNPFASVLGLFGLANGGVVKGGFREYAKGGIAKGPHIGIIGEGKHNEAVVPLPDGKSIPIDFPKGAMGGMQNNNVGVTINIDNEGGSSTDVESDRRDAANLGIQIADIVQQKLLDEKRIGGILSPYGAA